MLRALHVCLLLSLLVLTACDSGSNDDPPPDPVALLTEAADNIRASETFRLEALHSGAEYMVSVFITDTVNPVDVSFRRAVAQYVSPQQLQANVRVLLQGVAIEIDVFSFEDEQWFKLAGTEWLDGDFAPGFNPRTLIAEDTGFQAALAALTELEYVGTTSLEDGSGVYHLTGMAEGPDVTDLLVGMIEAEGLVPVDVFIDRESRYPSRLIITLPETDPENPTKWTIDVYDIDAENELTPPDAALELIAES